MTSLAILAVVGWAAVNLWNELPGVGDVAVREAKVSPADVERNDRKKSEAPAPPLLVKKFAQDSDRFDLSADGLEPIKDAPQPNAGKVRSTFDLVEAGDAGKVAPAKLSANVNGEFRGLATISPNVESAGGGRPALPAPADKDSARFAGGVGGGGALGYDKSMAAPTINGRAPTESRPEPVTLSRQVAAPAGAAFEKQSATTVTGPALGLTEIFFATPGPANAPGGTTLNEFLGRNQVAADQKLDALSARADQPTLNDVSVRRAPDTTALRVQSVAIADPPVDTRRELAFGVAPQNGAVYFFESQDGTTRPEAAAAARFSRVDAEGVAAAKTISPKANETAVLSAFELRRDAQKIHIIDADGSVYEGQIVSAGMMVEKAKVLAGAEKKLKEAEALKREQSVELKAAVAVPQSWSFRASGTNRTLHQLVTITGSMSGAAGDSSEFDAGQNKLGELSRDVSSKPAPTTPAPPSAVTAAGTRGMIRADDPAKTSAPQIQGKVRIGTGPERDLKAVRVTR